MHNLILKRFLGFVDLQGTSYESSTIASGYGAYIAQPLLRKAVEGKESTLTEAEAIKLLDDCMRVLFYRDARSLNKARTGNYLFCYVFIFTNSTFRCIKTDPTSND